MRRVLVTAISGNVANGILKALQGANDSLYGCDIYDYPVGMDKVSAYWKSDMALSPRYIKNLLDRCRQFEITHLIPVNEAEIKVISENLDEFEKRNIKVLINKKEMLDVFLDKYETVKALREVEGVDVPLTYLYDDFPDDGKQYILKFRNSCGSKMTEIVNTREQIETFKIDKGTYVIQEYLPNSDEEYTVGVFSDTKNIATIVFKRKLEHGYTSFVELVEDDSISHIAETIAKKWRLKGFINIQLRKQDGKNYIFEINPRISGTVFFRHMLGFNDVIWWLDLVDGKEIPLFTCQYKSAIGMRELSEKFVVLEKNMGARCQGSCQ